MNSREQAALAELVAQDQQRTSARIAALNRELEDIVENAKMSNGDDEHDPEGATIGFERSQVIALLDQARGHAAELAWAAERIESGTYGRCERCGGPIAFERLEAVPTVTTCVVCAAARSRRR
jgi:RNA polymerase-binding transcription factor DksA